MFKVIEYDSSGSYNDVSEKYVSIDNLKDLKVKLFDDYIDIEYVKSWFGNGKDDINIEIDDVFEFKSSIGLMSISEDMNLYIFNDDEVCNLIECFLFDLKIDDYFENRGGV